MVNTVADAVNAYASNQRQGAAGGSAETVTGTPFGEMMREIAGNAVAGSERAEQLSAQALVGQADINDVVVAVNNAEATLQTVVSMRDRLIQAYQEIIRMPI